MKIHRFIIPNTSYVQGEVRLTDEELVHQIHSVLRLTQGEHIFISNGAGSEMLCTITATSKKEVALSCDTPVYPNKEPLIDVHLFQTILKKENFELIVQKATEIGVTAITPVISGRTIKTGFVKSRLEKIIKEAAEQSGRTTIPILHDPLPLKEAFHKAASEKREIIFFDENNNTSTTSRKEKAVGLFIGPEGGWTPEEHSLAEENKATLYSLGKLTLRGETAAIIASYLACHNYL